MPENLLHSVLVMADAAMLSLIAAVQWLIYPSFQYYGAQQLVAWHRKYTLRIGLLVVPLMSTQLLGGLYRTWSEPYLTTIAYAVLIALAWGLTFAIFVPLHNKISKGRAERSDLDKLVNHNFYRTAVWSLAFLCNALLWFSPVNP